jgi:hypothetical protein
LKDLIRAAVALSLELKTMTKSKPNPASQQQAGRLEQVPDGVAPISIEPQNRVPHISQGDEIDDFLTPQKINLKRVTNFRHQKPTIQKPQLHHKNTTTSPRFTTQK